MRETYLRSKCIEMVPPAFKYKTFRGKNHTITKVRLPLVESVVAVKRRQRDNGYMAQSRVDR